MLVLMFSLIFMIPFMTFLLGDAFLLLFLYLLFMFSGMMLDYFMISDYFGYDCVSYFLLILSFFISYLMVYSSFYIKFFRFSSFYFILFIYLLSVFLLFSFFSFSSIGFYFFFEASLIPIVILIFGWGYQPERLQAGIYMLFYTVFASLPLLISLFLIFDCYDHLYYIMIGGSGLKGGYLEFFLSFFFILAFMVKLPLYMVHLWLPKAHVEAPVSGSMVLAAVLLKLGSYGLYRFIDFSFSLNFYLFVYMVFALLGGVVLSMVCSVQTDMKSLIAYSSVVHMGVMLGGLISFSCVGSLGALMMMIGHGFCSSGLFFAVNLMFERSGSRMISVNKGFLSIIPSFSMMVFFLCIFNVGVPPSISIFSEVLLSSSIMMWSLSSFVFLMMITLFSMIYSLYLFSFTQHGSIYDYFGFFCVSVRDYVCLFMHIVPVFLMIMFIFFFDLF